MKRLLLLVCLLLSLTAHAQVEWVHQLQFIDKHVMDSEDNIIAVGTFSGEITIGSIHLQTGEALTKFIFKVAPNGSVLWAKTFQGIYNALPGLAVDGEGNIFLSGGFHNDFYFDGVRMLSEKDQTWNTFLAMLNRKGEVAWIKSLAGTETYSEISPSENIFYNASTREVILTGSFRGAVRLDHVAFTSNRSSNVGNFFISVYSKEGNLVWAKVPLQEGFIIPEDIKGDREGNIYLTGRYGGTVKVDHYQFTAAYTDNGGTADIFLVKFLKDGSLEWIKAINKLQPHKLNHSGRALAIDNATGHLYLAANIKSNVDIDGFVVEKISQQAIGSDDWDNTIPSDILFACFRNSGQLVWAKTYGTTGHDYPRYTQLREGYQVGVLAGAWNSQPFFVAFDLRGNLNEPTAFIGGGSVEAVSVSPGNDYHVSGIFNGQLNLETTLLTATDVYNGFLLKLAKLELATCYSEAGKPAVYNVMTPNGDGDNDVLILPEVLTGSAIKVYNRWGKEVYRSFSYQNNWDGAGLPAGTYYYIIMNSCFGRISSPLTILY